MCGFVCGFDSGIVRDCGPGPVRVCVAYVVEATNPHPQPRTSETRNVREEGSPDPLAGAPLGATCGVRVAGGENVQKFAGISG